MQRKKSTEKFYIHGKHATLAALSNQSREIHQIYVSNQNFDLIPDKYKIITNIYTTENFNKILPGVNAHQGIAVLVSPLPQKNISDFNLEKINKIVILDQITDPQNYGAILRSAACFGIDLVINSKDNSAKESGVIAKTSASAIEKLNIAYVTNISKTIKILKDNNFWIIGLDGDAKSDINTKIMSGKICLVMGSEGKGIRRLTKENCDLIVKIPMNKNMESLNVSTASAIAFYNAFLAK